jgi:hypothetical protein
VASANTSLTVRGEIVEALRLDLVGPDNNHAFAHELLPESPFRWYLTGFLVPKTAAVEQRSDPTSTEEIDAAGDTEGTDDASPPDRAAARHSLLPSSMGLSVLVAPGVESFEATVSWGDYVWEGVGHGAEGSESEGGAMVSEGEPPVSESPLADLPLGTGDEVDGEAVAERGARYSSKARGGYRRIPREETLTITIPPPGERPLDFPVPDSRGLVVTVTARTVVGSGPGASRLPPGTRSVSAFVVNNRAPDEQRAYQAFAFQAELRLQSATPFVARPDLRGTLASEMSAEWDEQVADLHYQDVFEYAVGHGVSRHKAASSPAPIPNANRPRGTCCFTLSTPRAGSRLGFRRFPIPRSSMPFALPAAPWPKPHAAAKPSSVRPNRIWSVRRHGGPFSSRSFS